MRTEKKRAREGEIIRYGSEDTVELQRQKKGENCDKF